ncbi:MAG: glycosyltransferase [Thermoanaerobaculia bacterium]
MASRKPASSTHRVLFLITSSGTGGAENLFKELILRLDRSRFEPLFCSLRPAGATATVIELAGVPVFSLEMSERPSAVEMIRGWSQLRSIYQTHSIDIVQASLYRANVLAPMSVQMGQDMPRIVTSQHSLAPLSGRLPSLMTRRAHRLSDRVVAVSGAVRRYMIESERIPSEQIVVIPNGVDTQRFRLTDSRAARESLGLSAGELVIGAAGRLTPVKGFDTLIEAVRRLHLSGARPRLLIAGEGPERKRLQALIDGAGLGDQIQLLGLREDLAALYSVFDVFVLSSHREGSPSVVLEALASQCPVVATTVGGVPEIIEDGQSGILVPPGNPQALAQRLDELLRSETNRQLVAASGRARVRDHFDLTEITHQYEALYLDLLFGDGTVT